MATDRSPSPRRFRPWQLVMAWVGATALAVGVASVAVGAATRQVTDPTPVLLTQATNSPSPTPTPDDSPSPDGGPTSSPTADDSPTPREDASPDDDPTHHASEHESEHETEEPGTTSTETATRTESSIGGSASFRFENGRITVLWARPEPGFTVDVENYGTEARARFRSDSHESRIKADYEHGQPRIRIEERPEDDD